MCGLRNSIDEMAEEIAEVVVDEIPDSPDEIRETVPDDVQELKESTDRARITLPDETDEDLSIEAIVSDTPLDRYFE